MQTHELIAILKEHSFLPENSKHTKQYIKLYLTNLKQRLFYIKFMMYTTEKDTLRLG